MYKEMIQRISGGWTAIRLLYLMVGIFIIIQAIMEKQWFLLFFGGYFGSMGLFNYGCASGACYTGMDTRQPDQGPKAETVDTEYKEIKGH